VGRSKERDGATVIGTGSGKPALRQALQARGTDLDLIRELPSGPAACEPHQRPHTCQHLTARCTNPENSSCAKAGVHTCRKRLESADRRPLGVGQPGVQRHARRLRADLRIDPTLAHEGHQPAGQPGHVRRRRVLLDPRHEGGIRLRQRRRGLDEQPGELRGGRQHGCAVLRSRPRRVGRRLGSPLVRGARGRGCPVLGHPALHLFRGPRKAGGA